MPIENKTTRMPTAPPEERASAVKIKTRADSLQRRLDREAPLAKALFRRLDRDPTGPRKESRRYRLFAFCDLLIAESTKEVFEAPKRALEIALWAVDLASRLRPERYGQALIHDLQARAWGRVGNAWRVLGAHRDAEAAFQSARVLLEGGSGDLLAETELLDLEASLRRSQGRYPEALRLLARTVANYRRINDRHRLGRALISRGAIHGEAGDLARAIADVTRGLERIDVDAEPRLVLAARHNLAIYHAESGSTARAAELLAADAGVPPDDTWLRLRRRWVEGMIAHREGRLGEAEAAYVETRRGFIDKGLGYDAAQVSLSLATLYAEQGRPRQMKRLAAEMIPIFRSCEVDRETLAALMLFHRAAEVESVTARMLNDLAAGLERTLTAARRRSVLMS